MAVLLLKKAGVSCRTSSRPATNVLVVTQAARLKRNPASIRSRVIVASADYLAPVPAPAEAAVVIPSTELVPNPKARDLKAALLDSLYGTERGLAARSEVRAEINELVSQLEAVADVPSVEALKGKWRLLYTSNSAILAILAASRLPLVTVGDFFETINSATIADEVTLSVPLSKTTLSTLSKFTQASPRRLQLVLDKVVIHTPEPVGNLEVPSTVSVLGQALDVSSVKQALSPVEKSLNSAISSAADVVSQTPGLQIPAEGFSTWMLITYADEGLRVVRSDGGAISIFCKEP